MWHLLNQLDLNLWHLLNQSNLNLWHLLNQLNLNLWHLPNQSDLNLWHLPNQSNLSCGILLTRRTIKRPTPVQPVWYFWLSSTLYHLPNQSDRWAHNSCSAFPACQMKHQVPLPPSNSHCLFSLASSCLLFLFFTCRSQKCLTPLQNVKPWAGTRV